MNLTTKYATIKYCNSIYSSSTYNLMMCGWRNSFRFVISLLILLTISRFLMVLRLRILMATLVPVRMCSPSVTRERNFWAHMRLFLEPWIGCNGCSVSKFGISVSGEKTFSSILEVFIFLWNLYASSHILSSGGYTFKATDSWWMGKYH